MVLFSFLPASLIAFLLISPTALSTPTTPNDPFRALSLHKPEHPVCCLVRPLPPVEPIDDDVLLTFEEWKAKQLALQARVAQAKEKESSSRSQASENASNNKGGEPSSHPSASDAPVPSASTSVEVEDNSTSELLSPHFRVPLTDRFNYASLDCSARVHSVHQSAKSPSAILSSKKDRYMLSPCSKPNGQSHFVVVELCEDIRIDTVQLANFEFFSGVFKDFSVSVAKTYTTDAEGWTLAGTYKAKNVRGVQSFHPPTSLRDFYRYIRVDFLSHYSNEYYCPISLLRVYGLTHLEQWKWDIWEAESRAKRDELENARSSSSSVGVIDTLKLPQPTPVVDAGLRPRGFPANATREEVESFMDSLEDGVPLTWINTSGAEESVVSSSKDSALLSSLAEHGSKGDVPGKDSPDSTTPQQRHSPSVDVETSPTDLTEDESTIHGILQQQQHQAIAPDTPSHATLPASSVSEAASRVPDSSGGDEHSLSYISTSSESITDTNTTPSVHHSSPPSPSRSSSSSIIANTIPSVPAIPFIHPPAPPAAPTGGESIYRTIMNRLTALEANHTLYARYVEEQTASVRDMLKRLGEEVGRLEGIGKAQAQMYQRTVKDWERQRDRLEMEHWELMSRVDYLADEIVLEKRLGIAQLCLLLAVLVFMGLTRGSRGEALSDPAAASTRLFNKSMREWGRRHLSFSNDWASRFRSRSLTPQAPTRTPNVMDDKIQFPSSSRPSSALQSIFMSRTPQPTERAMQIKQMNASANERRPATATMVSSMGNKRSRTPTSTRTPNSVRTPTRHLNGHHYHRPMTPTGSSLHSAGRPHFLRTNSQGAAGESGSSPYGFAGIGPVPRSAKKWARSAHLHEVRAKDDRVRNTPGGRGSHRDRENEGENGNSGFRGAPAGDTLVKQIVDKKRKSPQVFGGHHRRPLSAMQVKRLSVDGSDSTENDVWVDTDADADGSELDLNSESDEVVVQPAIVASIA